MGRMILADIAAPRALERVMNLSRRRHCHHWHRNEQPRAAHSPLQEANLPRGLGIKHISQKGGVVWR